MKKTLLVGIVSLAASVAPSFGQGFVALDNYNSTVQPLITYGAGSGGTLGTGITGSQWTVGLYFGDGTIILPADPTGYGIPSVLNNLFQLGTGTGSTASLVAPGIFIQGLSFQATGAAVPATTSFVVVAYDGLTYATSQIRGHSGSFTMVPKVGTEFPPFLGDGMSTFSVVPVPEPTTMALAGLGIAGLLAFRRRS